MPLTRLECSTTQVSDLSPLKGMPLTNLDFHYTDVSDLSVLKGMRLTDLGCWNTQVSDLSPLKGMPMTSLRCTDSPVSDLSPLRGMSLTALSFTHKNITRGIDAVRQMKSIENISHLGNSEEQISTDKFWKKYDAGEFGKPTPSLTNLPVPN